MELKFKDVKRIEIRNKFSEEVVCVIDEKCIKASDGYTMVVYKLGGSSEERE